MTQPQPIATLNGAPLVVYVNCVKRGYMMEAGTSASSTKVEAYVLLSALPAELRERVVTACQAIAAGG